MKSKNNLLNYLKKHLFFIINPLLFLISLGVGFIPGAGIFLSIFFYYDAYSYIIVKYFIWQATYMRIDENFIISLLSKYYLLIMIIMALTLGYAISYFISWLWDKKESWWQNLLYSYLFTLILAPVLPLIIILLPDLVNERNAFISVFIVQMIWAIGAFGYLWVKFKNLKQNLNKN